MNGPNPATLHPLPGFPQVCFIKNSVTNPNILIGDYTYYYGWESAAPEPGDLPYKGDTCVGNDVWIGYDCLIMPGVTIGNGAIISSRSVVVSDVPAYSIVGGNPAKVIRQRFSDEVIAELEKIAWWDWPPEKVTQNLAAISGGDVVRLRQ